VLKSLRSEYVPPRRLIYLWWRLNKDQEVEYGGDVGILEGG